MLKRPGRQFEEFSADGTSVLAHEHDSGMIQQGNDDHGTRMLNRFSNHSQTLQVKHFTNQANDPTLVDRGALEDAERSAHGAVPA